MGSGGWGGGDVGREWEGLREVQEGRHSNRSPCCSEAELPLGKEIKCFLSISVGKVISQDRAGGAWLVGVCVRPHAPVPGVPRVTTRTGVRLGSDSPSQGGAGQGATFIGSGLLA